MDALYNMMSETFPDEDSCQATLANEMYPSPCSKRVLETVSSLYLQRHMLLEQVSYMKERGGNICW